MKNLCFVLAMFALAIFVTGCENSESLSTNVKNDDAAHSSNDESGHDHSGDSHTAAHGGHIICLGHNHEYHAELVDDHESGTVTVYMLDGNLKTMGIEQGSITLVLTAGTQTESFEIPAKENSTSEFSLVDAKMLEMLTAEHASGKLRVTINDKPFTGSFEHHAHDHDHDEH